MEQPKLKICVLHIGMFIHWKDGLDCPYCSVLDENTTLRVQNNELAHAKPIVEQAKFQLASAGKILSKYHVSGCPCPLCKLLIPIFKQSKKDEQKAAKVQQTEDQSAEDTPDKQEPENANPA